MRDGLFVRGELWDFWRGVEDEHSFDRFWRFVLFCLSDEDDEFIRRYAGYGSPML